MKIAICEDEPHCAEHLIGYINEWKTEKNVFTEIFAYTSAEKFLFEWEDREDYDIIFLDIKMGKITGLDLAELIRKTNESVAIVFVTGRKEYVLKGYRVAAKQYLLKPLRKKDCFDCLNQVYTSNKVKKYYLFTNSGKTFKLPHDDIIYIEMFSHDATMTTRSQKYTFRKTMPKILEELNNDLFIRCHKSYIVNIQHVDAVSRLLVFMSDGREISVSKNTAKEINEKFMKYNVSKV